jgi:polyhydroxyalkanoate synthesis regulator phasin
MAAQGGSSRKSGAKRSTAKRSSSTSKSRASASSRSRSSSKRSSSSRSSSTRRSSAATAGLDKSIENFRSSLERSLTLSRDRLQEAVDDAVRRGRMQRRDAEQLVSDLVSRSRSQTTTMLRDLEKMADQARKELGGRTGPARRQASQAARRAGRAARDAADRPLAEADRLRRRSPLPTGFPITAYDQLTAAQVKSRLGHLSRADLRKVRTYESNNQQRKGLLKDIDGRLD